MKKQFPSPLLFAPAKSNSLTLLQKLCKRDTQDNIPSVQHKACTVGECFYHSGSEQLHSASSY